MAACFTAKKLVNRTLRNNQGSHQFVRYSERAFGRKLNDKRNLRNWPGDVACIFKRQGLVKNAYADQHGMFRAVTLLEAQCSRLYTWRVAQPGMFRAVTLLEAYCSRLCT